MALYSKEVFAKNLQHYMDLFGMTRAEVAEYLHISVAAVGSWLNCKQIPRMDKVNALAKHFGVGISALLEPQNFSVTAEPSSNLLDDFLSFPVIGNIAAGYGDEAIEEETGETIQIPKALLRGRKPEDFMVLQIKGNSMAPQLLNGDYVLVLRCTSVDSGSIAVLLYDGNDSTVKKVNYKTGEDWLEMVPLNKDYPIKRIENSDLENCRVLGKVINLIRNYE